MTTPIFHSLCDFDDHDNHILLCYKVLQSSSMILWIHYFGLSITFEGGGISVNLSPKRNLQNQTQTTDHLRQPLQ